MDTSHHVTKSWLADPLMHSWSAVLLTTVLPTILSALMIEYNPALVVNQWLTIENLDSRRSLIADATIRE